MYGVRLNEGGSQAVEQVLGPFTLEAAKDLVAELARQQPGSQAFSAYVMRWQAPRRQAF